MQVLNTNDRGHEVEIAFNAEQAAAPIKWREAGDDDWQATPYQTADAAHDSDEAVRLVLAYLGQNQA